MLKELKQNMIRESIGNYNREIETEKNQLEIIDENYTN